MDKLKKIIIDFELHAVDNIRKAFEQGLEVNQIVNGQPLVYELINMYTRGPKFKECVRAFVDFGLEFDDRALLAVLLDDDALLESILTQNKETIDKRYSFNCTFTPIYSASLLHICAEYNHLACAKILVKHGADINDKAGIDEHGFGGQTPIFHTVNQHANICLDMLQFLIELKPDLDITVKGLIWGKGYDWETFIPSVNPISYAMMGLLRQFQRTEEDIYEVVTILLKTKHGIDYRPFNIPNKYLQS